MKKFLILLLFLQISGFIAIKSINKKNWNKWRNFIAIENETDYDYKNAVSAIKSATEYSLLVAELERKGFYKPNIDEKQMSLIRHWGKPVDSPNVPTKTIKKEVK